MTSIQTTNFTKMMLKNCHHYVVVPSKHRIPDNGNVTLNPILIQEI